MNNIALRFICRSLLAVFALLSVPALCMCLWLWRHSNDAWMVPLRVGDIELKVSATAGLRLLTQPVVARLLDGYQFQLSIGTVTTSWDKTSKTQHLVCAPCRIPARSLGTEAMSLAALNVSIQRENSHMQGRISAGAVNGTWHGVLTENNLEFVADVPRTPIIALYDLFRADIPELAVAQMEGHFDAHLQRSFPATAWQIQTNIDLASVTGLGTEALRGTQPVPACARAAAQLPGPYSSIARAVVAAEDQRFWQHRGYDPRELAKALQINAQRNEAVRGASTINQQLAKLLYVGSARNAVRKLRELLYAVEMEQTLGKAQILQLYLTIAPWGDSACGAEAAAQHYLAKSADEVNVQEAAWLAALLRNPALSIRNEELTKQHARWIVDGMTGISNSQRRKAKLALDTARL